MGGPVHASSTTERLPRHRGFSTDGNSYGVQPENRNRCATLTNCQVAKIVTAAQRMGHRPADDYGFTGVADTLARALLVLQV
jgi:hypothetical protein